MGHNANVTIRPMLKIHTQNGFSLIELVVTVAIVALLTTIAVPLAETTVKRSKEQELRQALRQIRTGIDDYKKAVDNGWIPRSVNYPNGYPPNLKILAEGVKDARNPDPKARLYFLRRVPRDPFFTDPTKEDDETWGKRSYASEPSEPKEGDDVYDVFSLATGTGLNGIPYKNW